MKHLLALSLMLSVAVPVWAEPPADIGESVEALRTKVGAPGVSIAIVEDGRTTLSRGWGVRKLGERAPIDAQTIFQTGSTSKAMTAAAHALLVDAGKDRKSGREGKSVSVRIDRDGRRNINKTKNNKL